jgi:hypothetical protein
MSIYSNNFKPTYLYIKQHAITGKLYFGKTTRKNVLTYKGSGSYWTNHIKKYGKEHVKTLWYHLFYDEETIYKFAVNFSITNNIVSSSVWANLIVEDGLYCPNHKDMISVKYPNSDKVFKVHKNDPLWINGLVVGINKGRIVSEESKEKSSVSSKQYWNTPEAKQYASERSKGKNNPMYGKVREQNWRYKGFNAIDVETHIKNGLNVNDIAKIYNCTPKCVRCRVLSDTGIHFKQWHNSLISSLRRDS